MPPPCLLPRKRSSKSKSGRHAGRNSDDTPGRPVSKTRPPVPAFLDGAQRPLLPPTASSLSRPVRGYVEDRGPVHRAHLAALASETPQAASFDFGNVSKRAAEPIAGFPSSKARNASLFGYGVSKPMPTRGVSQKSTIIDLTLDDSDDDLKSPSTPRHGNRDKSQAVDKFLDATTAERPVVGSSALVASTTRRPGFVSQYRPGLASSVIEGRLDPQNGKDLGDNRVQQQYLDSKTPWALPHQQPIIQKLPRAQLYWDDRVLSSDYFATGVDRCGTRHKSRSANPTLKEDVARTSWTQAPSTQEPTTVVQTPPLIDEIPRRVRNAREADTEPVPAQKLRSANSGPMDDTLHSVPNLVRAGDRMTDAKQSRQPQDTIRPRLLQQRESLKFSHPARARKDLHLAAPAYMPGLPHTQPKGVVGLNSQKAIGFAATHRKDDPAVPQFNGLQALGQRGSAQQDQPRRGALIAFPSGPVSGGIHEILSLGLGEEKGIRDKRAFGLPHINTTALPLTKGLPCTLELNNVNLYQPRPSSMTVPLSRIRDCGEILGKAAAEPQNIHGSKVVDGCTTICSAKTDFNSVDSDPNSTEERALVGADGSKRDRSVQAHVPGRTNSIQVRKGSVIRQQLGVTKRQNVGGLQKDTGASHDASGVSGASHLGALAPALSGVIPQDQAHKRDQTDDNLADGSNECEETISGSSQNAWPDENHSDRLQFLPPQENPRRSRRKHTKVVMMRAPPHELRRISLRPVQRPDVPMGRCFLVLLPLETQQEIYRYLLLAKDPIQVMNGWSQLNWRSRCNLQPAIMSTCRAIFENALTVLYSENVFQYKLRDKAQVVTFKRHQKTIALEKYLPMLRNLELRIERSRTELTYGNALAKAIGVLNAYGANLYTLTIDVTPREEGDTMSMVGYFYQQGEVIKTLKALKTLFIQIHVFTPRTKATPAKSLRCIIDKSSEVPEMEAIARKEDHRENSADSEDRWGPTGLGSIGKADKQLNNLSEMIACACNEPSMAIARDWFKGFEARPARWAEHLASQPEPMDDDRDEEEEDEDQLSDDGSQVDDSDDDFEG